ncbi:serine/threonine-protein kinase [Actinocorallia libanotica]|uniref:serine/threonine-protein kinase n=1 Tax=Actinocorallia libanotica TaxID=46162 RepID=UPI0031E02764
MTSGRNVVDGRFELLARLGSGGMGTVWRARDLALHREVALKEVRPGGGEAPPDEALAGMYRERVLREARALARIDHPHVVTIHHIIDEPDMPYPWLVMELVRGESLQDRLARGTMTPAEAARTGRGVLAALQAVHRAGICHRDIKPGNVLLRADGSPVLTDFGIAVLEEASRVTATGGLVGSPEYIAPERLHGHEGDPASDLWSLGMLLYVAVEGHNPVRRTTLAATLAAVMTARIPAPRHAGPLTEALAALLVPDPSARPDAPALDQLLARAETAPPAHPEPTAPPTPPAFPAGRPTHPAGGAALPGDPSAFPAGGAAFSGGSSGHPAGAFPGGPSAFSAGGDAFSGGSSAHPAGGAAFPGGPSTHPAGGAVFPGGPATHPAGPVSAAAPRRRAPLMLVGAGGLVLALMFGGGTLLEEFEGNGVDGADVPPSAPEPSRSAPAAAAEDDPPGEGGRPATLLTPAGIRGVIDAFEKATGNDRFTDFSVYEEYAYADVPVPGRSKAADRYLYRNGKVQRQGSGSGDGNSMSLRAFDWSTVPRLLRTADRKLNVPDPDNRYITIDPAWTFGGGRPAMLVYLADEHGGGYLAADAKGKVLRVYPAE